MLRALRITSFVVVLGVLLHIAINMLILVRSGVRAAGDALYLLEPSVRVLLIDAVARPFLLGALLWILIVVVAMAFPTTERH
jgi:hypothetical protein